MNNVCSVKVRFYLYKKINRKFKTPGLFILIFILLYSDTSQAGERADA